MYSLIGFVSEQLGDEIRSCTGSLWIANETELSYPASPSTFIWWGKLIALPLYENSYINNVVIFIFLRIRKLFVYFGLQYEVLNQKSNVKSNIFIGILLLFQRQNFLSLLLFNKDLGRRRKGTFCFFSASSRSPLSSSQLGKSVPVGQTLGNHRRQERHSSSILRWTLLIKGCVCRVAACTSGWCSQRLWAAFSQRGLLVRGKRMRRVQICLLDTSAPVHDVSMETEIFTCSDCSNPLSCLAFSYTKGDLDFTYVTSRIIGECLTFFSCSPVPFILTADGFNPVLFGCDLSQ